MRYAILCPGRSLKDTYKGGDYDCVVAITAAIFLDTKIDIWCVAENPAHKHQPRYQLFSERFFELKPVIWTLKGIKERWHHLWDVPEDHPIVARNVDEMVTALRWPKKEKVVKDPYMKLSFFHAIWCSLLAGATELDIHGHDMLGVANYDGRTGEALDNKKPKAIWEQRWQREKVLWKEVSRLLTKNGVAWTDHGSGMSSQAAPPVSESAKQTSSEDQSSQSTEPSASVIERLFTSGQSGTTQKDSSTKSKAANPSSTLPSSFGLDQSDSATV